MTFNELLDWVAERLPDALINEGADGELIIETGLKYASPVGDDNAELVAIPDEMSDSLMREE